jgi:hypothetical protein
VNGFILILILVAWATTGVGESNGKLNLEIALRSHESIDDETRALIQYLVVGPGDLIFGPLSVHCSLGAANLKIEDATKNAVAAAGQASFQVFKKGPYRINLDGEMLWLYERDLFYREGAINLIGGYVPSKGRVLGIFDEFYFGSGFTHLTGKTEEYEFDRGKTQFLIGASKFFEEVGFEGKLTCGDGWGVKVAFIWPLTDRVKPPKIED